MASTHRERETKFDVPEDFRLPDVAAFRPGRADTTSTLLLESTYFDTADQSLLSNRLTLRRRTGDADAGWQLKVPQGAARLEVGPVAADLESALVSERITALAELRTALDSDRYLTLLRRVNAFADDPMLAEGTSAEDLLAIAAIARRKAAKRLATGRASGDAMALHRRKAVKRSCRAPGGDTWPRRPIDHHAPMVAGIAEARNRHGGGRPHG